MVTSLGKRTSQLDLTAASDHAALVDLARNCDVFLQAYRPGGLENKGFGVEKLVELRPGIICANLNAWGWDGPWKDRRGVSLRNSLICLDRFSCDFPLLVRFIGTNSNWFQS